MSPLNRHRPLVSGIRIRTGKSTSADDNPGSGTLTGVAVHSSGKRVLVTNLHVLAGSRVNDQTGLPEHVPLDSAREMYQPNLVKPDRVGANPHVPADVLDFVIDRLVRHQRVQVAVDRVAVRHQHGVVHVDHLRHDRLDVLDRGPRDDRRHDWPAALHHAEHGGLVLVGRLPFRLRSDAHGGLVFGCARGGPCGRAGCGLPGTSRRPRRRRSAGGRSRAWWLRGCGGT